MKTLTEAEQEIHENIKGLFNTLSEKAKQQYNEILLSLQFCKLMRNADESTEE